MSYNKQNDASKNFRRSIFYKATISALVIASSMFTTSAIATVYKVTAPDGKITFTDNPHSYHNDKNMHIEPVNVPPTPTAVTSSPSSSSSSSTYKNRQSNALGNQPLIRTMSTADYDIEIISPENEQVFRRPAQNVDIIVAITPSLKSGDKVNVLLDDELITHDLNISIPTLDMTPGTHTLAVQVISTSGDAIIGKTIEFYVIQNTLTYQRNKQLAERLNAYNDLPWYTKVYLQLRQNELHQDDKPVDVHGQNSSSFSNGGSGSAF